MYDCKFIFTVDGEEMWAMGEVPFIPPTGLKLSWFLGEWGLAEGTIREVDWVVTGGYFEIFLTNDGNLSAEELEEFGFTLMRPEAPAQTASDTGSA